MPTHGNRHRNPGIYVYFVDGSSRAWSSSNVSYELDQSKDWLRIRMNGAVVMAAPARNVLLLEVVQP